MQRQTSYLAPLMVTVALLALAAYPLSYLALADHVAWYPCMQTLSGRVYISRSAHYRVGGEAAVYCFQPMERLDRWYRPGYWEWHESTPSALTWQPALEYAEDLTATTTTAEPEENGQAD